ncbi:MAG: hypothetical protein EU530_09790, partial [Promethearchaeota archaeon]
MQFGDYSLVALITSFLAIALLKMYIIQSICIVAFTGYVFSLLLNGSWKITVNKKQQEEMQKKMHLNTKFLNNQDPSYFMGLPISHNSRLKSLFEERKKVLFIVGAPNTHM